MDFGIVINEPIEVKSDASAAIGITQRRGMGKVWHIETNQLWLQGQVASGSIKVGKIAGAKKIADQLTPYVSKEGIMYHMRETGHDVVAELIALLYV